MLPTHDVRCPGCGGFLYTSTSLDDGVNTATPESPKVENDAQGLFMRCPHCRARVEMERYSAEGREAYRLARPRQGLNDSRP